MVYIDLMVTYRKSLYFATQPVVSIVMGLLILGSVKSGMTKKICTVSGFKEPERLSPLVLIRAGNG